jgi:hypothetical protein
MSLSLPSFVQAPAAFGLVSFLMTDGIDRKRIRRHLLVFSLAAPLMAICTFAILKSVSVTYLEHTHTLTFSHCSEFETPTRWIPLDWPCCSALARSCLLPLSMYCQKCSRITTIDSFVLLNFSF